MNKNFPSIRYLEPELKASILNHLKTRISLNSYGAIINEFTVENFSRRVDLALISNNDLFAFEVKSEADTLHRLEGQTQKYLEYFDKVIVVAATKHIPKILDSVPINVAVWEADNNRIIVRRRGKKIKITTKESFLELMNVNELIKLSNQLKIKSESKRRKDLVVGLMSVAKATLRNTAIKSIQLRYALTTGLFLQAIADNDIKPADIKKLSQNKYERKSIKSNSENISKIIKSFDLN